MTTPRPPSFHLRMPRRLKDALQAAGAKRGKSLTQEINARLERSLEADDVATELAEILKPLIDGLTASEREMVFEAARILARNKARKRK